MKPKKKNGDPTKADTTRLVNYSDNLVKALIDAGYVESERSPVLEIEKGREIADEEYVDVDDVIKGMVNYPWLAQDMVYLLPKDDYGSRSGYEFSQEQQKKIAEGLKPFVDFINKNLPEDLRYLREEITADFMNLLESSNKDFGEFDRDLGRLNSRLKDFIIPATEESERKGEAVPQFVSKAVDDYITVSRGVEYDTQAPRALALAGGADIEKIEQLENEGYEFGQQAIRYRTDLSRGLAKIGNIGVDLFNMLTSDTQTVDMGDRGVQTITNDSVERFDVPEGRIGEVQLYPNVKPYTRSRPFEREQTNFYEDQGDGFYTDREMDRVVNEEVPPSLFREGITPANRVAYWNPALKDLVDVYLYDSPEMKKAAGREEPKREEIKTQGGDDKLTRLKSVKVLKKKRGKMNPVRSLPARRIEPKYPEPEIKETSTNIPMGRPTVQIGKVAQDRKNARYGQVLDREYYWDNELKKYQMRPVDEERKGQPMIRASF